MYQNIENLEKINYTILRSIYILAENLYTNRFDMPISRADLAFFEKKHLYILLYNNGSEFGLHTIELSNMQKHTALSTDDKKRLIGKEIDSFNDNKRDSGFFDDYRFLEPLHITQGNDMEADYYIVYSTNGRFCGNSVLLHEVLKLFSAHWGNHIDERKALPNSIYDNENQLLDFSVENAETIKNEAFQRIFSQVSDSRIYDFHALCSCIEEISQQTYEKSIAHGVFAFTTDELQLSYEFLPFIPFEKPYLRMIRKLMETTKNGAMVVRKGKVVGFTLNYSANDFVIKIVERSKWNCEMENKVFFQCIDGTILVPSVSDADVEFTSNYRCEFAAYDNCERLTEIQKMARKQKHGTGIIITNEASKEAERLCSLDRGMMIKPINLYENLPLVEHLTAIDGAILIDPDGMCYAIGVIVDGIATIAGSKARGARYNSLLTYVAWKASEQLHEIADSGAKDQIRCMAIIISEDGTIDYLTTSLIKQQNKNAHTP